MIGIKQQLSYLFHRKLLFTVDELVKLTGSNHRTIRTLVAYLKNPKYANNKPLRLVQTLDKEDRYKRWGLVGVSEKYSDRSATILL